MIGNTVQSDGHTYYIKQVIEMPKPEEPTPDQGAPIVETVTEEKS